jgi:hypothetical protein
MEDRCTPGLWLEMTDGDPQAYAAVRVPDVLALPDVDRATWWGNVHRDRRDLPRELDDFDVLGVYEVGERFRPPPTPPGVAGLHYVRTPRPGQGCLSGRPTIGLSLVLISPTEPRHAQALRDWGDFVHIRHIAEAGVPGMTMITPYQHAGGGDPRFLHFYEIDSDDPERTFKAMTPLVTELIGPPDSDAWKHWATHPSLRIMYVNTFARIGARTRDDLSSGTERSIAR